MRIVPAMRIGAKAGKRILKNTDLQLLATCNQRETRVCGSLTEPFRFFLDEEDA